MKSKTPSLTNNPHPLRRVAGHFGFVFAALSLGANFGCSAASKDAQRVSPEAELDASAVASNTTEPRSPGDPSSTADASASNAERDDADTPTSPTVSAVAIIDASVEPADQGEDNVTPKPSATSPADIGVPSPSQPKPPADTGVPSQPKPPQTTAETNTDEPDAGPVSTNAEPSVVDEATTPSDPKQNETPPVASDDVDASAPVDAAVQDEVTPSIVYEVSVCMGDAVHYYEDAGRPVEEVHCDEPGCGSQHRACEDWDESDCEREEGCHWGLQQVVNEGTDTGKHCHGEPLSCEVWVGSCLPGCSEVESTSGRARACVGTPTPCSTHRYSEACAGQLGCEWR